MRANRVATRLRHELQSFQEAHIWGSHNLLERTGFPLLMSH
jgi:hypothetical protein